MLAPFLQHFLTCDFANHVRKLIPNMIAILLSHILDSAHCSEADCTVHSTPFIFYWFSLRVDCMSVLNLQSRIMEYMSSCRSTTKLKKSFLIFFLFFFSGWLAWGYSNRAGVKKYLCMCYKNITKNIQ